MVHMVSVGKSSHERGWFSAFQSLGPSCLSLQWTLAKENVCHVGMSEDWVLISKQEKSSVVSAGRHRTTK